MKVNILQQPPFRFVDDMLDYVDDRIRCSHKIKADNPMLEGNKLPAEGLIECMAQTAAVKSSIDDPKNADNVGYLVSVKNLVLSGQVGVGDTVVMDLILIQKLMQFSIFGARLYKDEMLIAECELRIFDTVSS